MTAIPFVRRTANERVDGTLTVKIDIEPMYKLRFLQMFPEIGAAGALAALLKGVDISTEKKPERAGQLCVMACTFCADPHFWDWCGVEGEPEAKAHVLSLCGVASRKELDADSTAGQFFHANVRGPYLAWRAGSGI